MSASTTSASACFTQFFQAGWQGRHTLGAHMDAADQVQVLPAGKRDIQTGPGVTARKGREKRCFYTLKQTHTRFPGENPMLTRQAARCKPRRLNGGVTFADYWCGLKRSSRLALLTTVMEESAIAAPATTGLSSVPVSGQRIPAAIGIPSEL